MTIGPLPKSRILWISSRRGTSGAGGRRKAGWGAAAQDHPAGAGKIAPSYHAGGRVDNRLSAPGFAAIPPGERRRWSCSPQRAWPRPTAVACGASRFPVGASATLRGRGGGGHKKAREGTKAIRAKHHASTERRRRAIPATSSAARFPLCVLSCLFVATKLPPRTPRRRVARTPTPAAAAPGPA